MTPRQQIELVLLSILVEDTPDECRFAYYFPFKYLMDLTQLDREIVRGFMRSMRDRRLVEYGRGFDEDGFVVGGGYTLTPAGEKYVKDLKLSFTLEREAFAEQVRRPSPQETRADEQSWGATNYA